MWVGLLTDRINNKLKKSYLINEHAFNRQPVPLNSFTPNLSSRILSLLVPRGERRERVDVYMYPGNEFASYETISTLSAELRVTVGHREKSDKKWPASKKNFDVVRHDEILKTLNSLMNKNQFERDRHTFLGNCPPTPPLSQH